MAGKRPPTMPSKNRVRKRALGKRVVADGLRIARKGRRRKPRRIIETA